MADLLQAIKLEQIRMIELMVQMPGTIPQQSLDDALILAVKSNRTKIMEILLLAGADPNTVDKAGTSVLSLMTASKHGAAGPEILLKYGADVLDQKALHNAARYGNSDAVELLLRNGANVDGRDSSGATALIIAAKFTQSMETISGTLLQYGACVNAQDRDRNTALHYAVMKLRGIETLVRHGDRADVPNADGNTALMYAAAEGLCSVIRVLMRSKSDVNVRNSSAGKTAMHILAMKGHACCVRELLQNGGDPNVRDSDGRTPLDDALQRQQLMTSRLLLQYNSERTTEDDVEAMTELLLNGNYDLVKVLIASGADTRELEQLMTQSYRHDVSRDMVTWLDDHVINKPRTLLEMSRFKIRRLIGARNFYEKCDHLPLPRYLKDILLMIDLDHYG